MQYLYKVEGLSVPILYHLRIDKLLNTHLARVKISLSEVIKKLASYTAVREEARRCISCLMLLQIKATATNQIPK